MIVSTIEVEVVLLHADPDIVGGDRLVLDLVAGGVMDVHDGQSCLLPGMNRRGQTQLDNRLMWFESETRRNISGQGPGPVEVLIISQSRTQQLLRTLVARDIGTMLAKVTFGLAVRLRGTTSEL